MQRKITLMLFFLRKLQLDMFERVIVWTGFVVKDNEPRKKKNGSRNLKTW